MVLTPLQKLALHVVLRSLRDDDAMASVHDYLHTYPGDAQRLAGLVDHINDGLQELPACRT